MLALSGSRAPVLCHDLPDAVHPAHAEAWDGAFGENEGEGDDGREQQEGRYCACS